MKLLPSLNASSRTVVRGLCIVLGLVVCSVSIAHANLDLARAFTPSQQELVKKKAKEYLCTDVGFCAFCNPMRKVEMANVEAGTVLRNKGNPDYGRVPAIIARSTWECVNRFAGTVKQQDTWIILAYDEEFSMWRCMDSAGEKLVRKTAEHCGFEPKN